MPKEVEVREFCGLLPVWLHDWPATVRRKLLKGVSPEQVKVEGRELAAVYCDRVVDAKAAELKGVSPEQVKVEGRELVAVYCDRVVDAKAAEIAGECREAFVCRTRRMPDPPWGKRD